MVRLIERQVHPCLIGVNSVIARFVAEHWLFGHPDGMENEPDGFEQSARIVEAFSAGRSDDVAALLAEIARAIRDHAIDD